MSVEKQETTAVEAPKAQELLFTVGRPLVDAEPGGHAEYDESDQVEPGVASEDDVALGFADVLPQLAEDEASDVGVHDALHHSVLVGHIETHQREDDAEGEVREDVEPVLDARGVIEAPDLLESRLDHFM